MRSIFGSLCRQQLWYDKNLCSVVRQISSNRRFRGSVKDQMLPTFQWDDEELFVHCTAKPKTVSIIGAPMTHGQPFIGTDSGPQLLREAGLRQMLTSLGWRVDDVGNLKLPERFDSVFYSGEQNAKNSILVGEGAKIIAAEVYKKACECRFPLLLGGDHSVGIGSLAGILKARPNTGVLWIDAHADLNIPDHSPSGNMHGMPVGLLLKEMQYDLASISGLEWLELEPDARLSADSIVYVGLRDVDPEERKAIKKFGILAFTMTDIDRWGIGKVMEMALEHLKKKDSSRPIHLSYDIDAVDPGVAPATGTAVRGGLTYREALYVAEAAAGSGLLASADIVELNPSLSDAIGVKETTEMGLQIVTSLLGKSII